MEKSTELSLDAKKVEINLKRERIQLWLKKCEEEDLPEKIKSLGLARIRVGLEAEPEEGLVEEYTDAEEPRCYGSCTLNGETTKWDEETDAKDPRIKKVLGDRRFGPRKFPFAVVSINRMLAKMAARDVKSDYYKKFVAIMTESGDLATRGCGTPAELTLNGVELTYKELALGALTLREQEKRLDSVWALAFSKSK